MTQPQPDPRSGAPLTAADLDAIEYALMLAPDDAPAALLNDVQALVAALRAAWADVTRLMVNGGVGPITPDVVEREHALVMRLIGERDQARADLARAERERDQARAALRRLAEWCQRGEFATQAVLAHAHGFRASSESLAEAEVVWADVRAALAAPGAARPPEEGA